MCWGLCISIDELKPNKVFKSILEKDPNFNTYPFFVYCSRFQMSSMSWTPAGKLQGYAIERVTLG